MVTVRPYSFFCGTIPSILATPGEGAGRRRRQKGVRRPFVTRPSKGRSESTAESSAWPFASEAAGTGGGDGRVGGAAWNLCPSPSESKCQNGQYPQGLEKCLKHCGCAPSIFGRGRRESPQAGAHGQGEGLGGGPPSARGSRREMLLGVER